MILSGQIIRDYIKLKDINQKKLAKDIGEKSASGFWQKLQKNDLSTDLIYKISISLKHDFFAEMSKQMPKNIRQIQNANNSSVVDSAIVDLLKEKFPNVFK